MKCGFIETARRPRYILPGDSRPWNMLVHLLFHQPPLPHPSIASSGSVSARDSRVLLLAIFRERSLRPLVLVTTLSGLESVPSASYKREGIYHSLCFVVTPQALKHFLDCSNFRIRRGFFPRCDKLTLVPLGMIGSGASFGLINIAFNC